MWQRHFAVEQWGTHTVKMSNRWTEEHKCETELTRQTNRGTTYWNIWLRWHDGCLRFIIHVQILLDVTEQHDVRQTDKSQFEVSLSYLCPSHLWHYCVQLVHPSCAVKWWNWCYHKQKIIWQQQKPNFCFVQAKLKGKYCNAWIKAWSEAGMQLKLFGAAGRRNKVS